MREAIEPDLKILHLWIGSNLGTNRGVVYELVSGNELLFQFHF